MIKSRCCIVCRRKFKPSSPAFTCSDECALAKRREANRAHQEAWRRRNPEENRRRRQACERAKPDVKKARHRRATEASIRQRLLKCRAQLKRIEKYLARRP